MRADLETLLGDGDLLGRVLDTFVLAQLRAEGSAVEPAPLLHHLRKEQGRREVDILAELAPGRVIGLEVKATSAPRRRDARHLVWLRDELGDRFVAGVVLHTGPHNYELGDRIVAAPICTLWARTRGASLPVASQGNRRSWSSLAKRSVIPAM